jgi:HEAT repeat protein
MAILDELFSGDDERAAAAVPLVTDDNLPALEAVLAGRQPDSRWWAVVALAHLAHDHATQLLLRAAVDPDPDLRAAALHALGQRATPEAIATLLHALGDPSDYLARLATESLIRVARPAVAALIQALQHDPQPRLRANAARALAIIADPAAIPALFAALSDDSILVQHWAEEGLDRMGVGQIYFKP